MCNANFKILRFPYKLSFALIAALGILFFFFPNEGKADEVGHIATLLNKAYVSANEISDQKEKFNAFEHLIDAHVRIGQTAQALKISEEIKNSNIRDQALQEIAISQAKNGDIKGALKTRNTMSPGYHRFLLLTELGSYQFLQGDTKGASATFQEYRIASLENSNNRNVNENLFHLIWFQLKIEDIAGARKTISFMESTQPLQVDIISAAKAALAKKLVEINDWPGAKEIISRIKREPTRSYTLASISEALVNLKKIAKAKKIAELIEDIGIRRDVLSIIAQGHFLKGEQATANTILDLQYKEALQNKDTNTKDEVLLNISHSYLKIDILESAKKAASQISKGSTGKIYALQRITAFQGKTGDIKGALETAEKTQSGRFRIEFTLQIADELAKAGELGRIFDWVKEIKHEFDKAASLLIIAKAYLKVEQVEKARSVLEIIPLESFRMEGLQDVGTALVKLNGSHSASNWANQFQAPLKRTKAFLGIIEGLLPSDGRVSEEEKSFCNFCGALYRHSNFL